MVKKAEAPQPVPPPFEHPRISEDPPDLLVCFLYGLMRDLVPPGKAEGVMVQVRRVTNMKVDYTNKHLEAYARELAQELMYREGER